ncbi:MAG: hypothetical protein KatS3mg076_0886 [Candidatus Binatia bacterium]|nr:MAG: hypothetical protein KatS3mg076_0886 [Candidatus Binatia bacterium]
MARREGDTLPARLLTAIMEVRRATDMEVLRQRFAGDVLRLRDGSEFVAKSPSMRRVVELALRVAPTDATVLLTGESGTGKERLARLVHEHSRRRNGPFLAVDCGALPEPLLESELFGHKRGAFTGAVEDRAGLFEAASGGTLFLDEIGETSPALQVKLLRVLQERTVRPVGVNRDRRVDVRIVAATNRNLADLVAERKFRKDLYYRLRVVELEIPPLRNRKEDLLPLARSFIQKTCAAYSCGPCSLSSEVLDLLLAYDWPGNVRELEHAIERAVVLAENQPTIRVEDLPPEIRALRASPEVREAPERIQTLAEVEKRHILETLARLGGNRKETARALGIGENTLHRKLRAYGIPRRKARRK